VPGDAWDGIRDGQPPPQGYRRVPCATLGQMPGRYKQTVCNAQLNSPRMYC
jgi:hypothetical protein